MNIRRWEYVAADAIRPVKFKMFNKSYKLFNIKLLSSSCGWTPCGATGCMYILILYNFEPACLSYNNFRSLSGGFSVDWTKWARSVCGRITPPFDGVSVNFPSKNNVYPHKTQCVAATKTWHSHIPSHSHTFYENLIFDDYQTVTVTYSDSVCVCGFWFAKSLFYPVTSVF